ncbi:MAG TPA: hypothetical protein VH814_02570 [Steroidobacteraceae bacterium]|jgi:hypothetical protein
MSDLDSTQTIRALSPEELYDSHHPRWHAIQLVVSDRPVNLDMMPRLDAFLAHRLYAVIGKQNGANVFALRLGFFPDFQAAQAICDGLSNYFSSASVVRVSAAEQERFARPQPPRATTPKPATPSTAAPRPSVAPSIAPVRAATSPAPRQKTAPTSGAAKKRPKTLSEQLMEEARAVQLSRSGRHRVPEKRDSWLARLLGGAKR